MPGMTAQALSAVLIGQSRHSVMSGVITGPYFLKFFNEPSALEVGTMVAVLEIGAFGRPLALHFFRIPRLNRVMQ